MNLNFKVISKVLNSDISIMSANTSSGQSEFIGSVFFTGISILLTTVNILRHASLFMTISTALLSIGFIITAVLAQKKMLFASRLGTIILSGIVFSFFALTGGNDGFAILWILLIPVISALWVGLKPGIILSLYFQIFLIVLFYTPASSLVEDYYSSNFMLRFPMLYLAGFGSIALLMWQREALLKKLYTESYFDALTGLKNRRSFNEASENIKNRRLDPGFTVFSFDLNSLKYANDNFGHNAGDELIKAAADIIRNNLKGSDCFRTGGDEYAAFAYNIDAEKVIQNINRETAVWKGEYMSSISISSGYANAASAPGLSLEELFVLADSRMYEAKEKFYRERDMKKDNNHRTSKAIRI